MHDQHPTVALQLPSALLLHPIPNCFLTALIDCKYPKTGIQHPVIAASPHQMPCCSATPAQKRSPSDDCLLSASPKTNSASLVKEYGMFISVIHGNNKEFLANVNCPVLLLLQYLKNKLEIPKTDTIDLCNEAGVLKLLFLARDPLENGSRFFTPRGTYYVCKVQRGEPGTTNENTYEAIYPLLENPDPDLCEALKRQRAFLEKNRVKLAKLPEAKRTRSSEILGPVPSAVSQPWMKVAGKPGQGGSQETPLKKSDSKTRTKVETGRKERHK
ncbi:uncharacterized protein CXorf65 homolog [Rhinatrema bivittatum]|uniref:uncharacterized protein CXorf65 homolog n=1 Tax=Rhinatrema bivittatum TaxID=194408 RepID=UPI00112BD723|nr:uncharacterized protein CXorf65 homolog [Rhinatrema bivittatum]